MKKYEYVNIYVLFTYLMYTIVYLYDYNTSLVIPRILLVCTVETSA